MANVEFMVPPDFQEYMSAKTLKLYPRFPFVGNLLEKCDKY